MPLVETGAMPRVLLAPAFLAAIAVTAATATATATSAWIQPLTLAEFNENFGWNVFCAVRRETTQLPETHVYKDLETGELRSKDPSQHDVGRRDVYLDSSYNETTCKGSSMYWVERVADDATWQALVASKTSAVVAGGDARSTRDHENDNSNNNDDDTTALWIAELLDARGLRDLPRDAHVHRKAGSRPAPSSTPRGFFAVAYMTVGAARRFAEKWSPAALFPVPDTFKLQPSAFMLAHPEALGGLLDDDDDNDDDAGLVDVLAEVHVAQAQEAAGVDVSGLTAQRWQAWLVEHNFTTAAAAGTPTSTATSRTTTTSATRAGAARVLLKLLARPGVLELVLAELVLADPLVVSVEARPRFHLHNQYATVIIQDGTLSDSGKPIYDQGLTGAGQIVGVGDSGLDVRSCFFREASSTFPVDNQNNLYPNAEKVVQYVAFADNMEGEASGHGTHVAGTVAGFGGGATGSTVISGSQIAMDAYRGVAYNAKIAFYDMGLAGSTSLSVPGDLYDDFLGMAYDVGARLHTNSWGTDINAYDSTARDMDRYSYDHQDFLVLVAAGNTGSLGFRTIGTPATGKNVLAVGASMTSAYGFADSTTGPSCQTAALCNGYYADLADNLASFSSLGPTFDGRMKPEVVAPGYFISSAYSSANPATQTCAVEAKSGTSMATPVVAGAAALVREYFVDRKGFTPMGALVKAMLVHSGSPLSDPDWERGLGNEFVKLDGLPDSNQGFGLVSLQKVLQFDDSDFGLRYLGACSGECGTEDFANLPNVAEGEVREEVVVMSGTTGSTTLSATLVWHDPAGSAFTNTAVLINDLDLVIEGPDGTTYYPFTLTGATGVNTVDNTEKVEVPLASVVWGGRWVGVRFACGGGLLSGMRSSRWRESVGMIDARHRAVCGWPPSLMGTCVGDVAWW
jgi:hypothetical protein